MRGPAFAFRAFGVSLAFMACDGGRPQGPPPPPARAPSSLPAPPSLAPLTDRDRTEAAALVANDCQACHAPEMLAQQRLTGTQWAAVIKKMQGWGSPLPPDSAALVARYLGALYSPSSVPPAATPFEPKAVAARDAASTLAALPDRRFRGGSAAKGQVIYAAGCAGCHGADATGTPLGVGLTDRPLLYRAAELAAVVRTGRGRMPASPHLSDDDLASLLAYLRRLRPVAQW